MLITILDRNEAGAYGELPKPLFKQRWTQINDPPLPSSRQEVLFTGQEDRRLLSGPQIQTLLLWRAAWHYKPETDSGKTNSGLAVVRCTDCWSRMQLGDPETANIRPSEDAESTAQDPNEVKSNLNDF